MNSTMKHKITIEFECETEDLGTNEVEIKDAFTSWFEDCTGYEFNPVGEPKITVTPA